MTTRLKSEDAIVLQFGGGIHSRASEDQINTRECSAGQNFVLTPGNSEFKPRPPFDLVGTLPNGAEVRGFATLAKTDGTYSMLIQGADKVYSWDGLSTFTEVGTCEATAKLRGPRQANWALDDKVIISDLNLVDEIKEWDGTTFQETTFLQSDKSTPFGALRSRYARVVDERLILANIHESSQAFEHVLVGSERGDYTVISTGDRPASSLSEEDPWFLPTPQLRPINGLAEAYGVVVVSQEKGAFEKLTGSSAKDYALEKFFHGSAAAGREAVTETDDDVFYGRGGRIESLQATDQFGDVELADPSFHITPDIESYSSWSVHFNPRLRRLYCFPSGESECWVSQIDMLQGELSSWAKWTTQHPMAMQPTASMVCYDPQDGLEYLFMGDASGNVYRMEGSGLNGDGGTASIKSSRRSVLFSAPVDSQVYDIDGWLKHRKNLALSMEICIKYSGEHVHDVSKTLSLTEVDFSNAYSASSYYGGNFYYGAQFENRFIRKRFTAPGQSNDVQVELEADTANTFALSECGLHFQTAS